VNLRPAAASLDCDGVRSTLAETMTTVHDVLRMIPGTSVTNLERGSRFEKLMRSYLGIDSTWTEQFSPSRQDAKRSVASDKKEERRKAEMSQNWYAMTASVIYPLACADGVPEEALAITTAKLCHQAQFWDGRSRFPVPLHAAKQMDLDHPQYRRTAAPEERPVPETGTADPSEG